MTRDEFIDLLARLVADGDLTELDAQDLLAQFDAGEITDVPSVLPTPEAIREPKDDNRGVALVLLLALLATYGRPQLRPLPPRTSAALANAIQDQFAARVADLAARFGAGDIILTEWQRRMLDEVEQHVLQQMYLGNGQSALTQAQVERLRTIVQEQGAYLQRFADQTALRIGQGTPFSEAYIANRGRLYGGIIRDEYFRSSEEAGAARGDYGAGWVVDYRAVDDRNTCSPCYQAEQAGPYLVGEGPMPGTVCLGGGSCRCERVPRYDPAAYNLLAGL